MIHFFKSLRNHYIRSNNVSRYLKYAIGEILLVVIGILIALQINNWNQFKKDRVQEKEILQQLQSEFESNLKQLDEKINIRKDMIAASLNLLHYVDNPETGYSDSIQYYIALTQLAPTFDPIVSDIISTDRIQFIQNNRLKEKLSLWTSEIIQVTEEEDLWKFYISTGYQPFLIEKGIHRSIVNQFWKRNVMNLFQLDRASSTKFTIGNAKNDDVTKLTEDPRFEGYLAQCVSFSELTNSQSESLRERIMEILDLIGSELNS